MPLCALAVPLELALNQQEAQLGRPSSLSTLMKRLSDGAEPFTELISPEQEARATVLNPTGIGEKYELVTFAVGDLFRICYTDTDNGVWHWEKTNDPDFAVVPLGLQTLTELPDSTSYC